MISKVEVAEVWMNLSNAAVEVAHNVMEDRPREVVTAMLKYHEYQVKAATLIAKYADQEMEK